MNYNSENDMSRNAVKCNVKMWSAGYLVMYVLLLGVLTVKIEARVI